jgi:hypothetical protein
MMYEHECVFRIHTRKCSAGVVYTNAHGSLEVLAHSGFKWLKFTKNKFTWCNFTNFYIQISKFHIISVTAPSGAFKKFVKQSKALVWSVNFTIFSTQFLADYLPLSPTVYRGMALEFLVSMNSYFSALHSVMMGLLCGENYGSSFLFVFTAMPSWGQILSFPTVYILGQ